MSKNSKAYYPEQQKDQHSKKFADFAKSENHQSGTYEGAMTDMVFVCPAGHSFNMSPSKFKQGRRCPACGKEKRKIRKSKELSDIATLETYQVEGPYINNSTKMEFICDKKHSFDMTANDFKKGVRCPVCARNRVNAAATIQATQSKINAEIIFANLVASKDHIALSPYNGAHKAVLFQCDNWHLFNATPSNFKHGNGCPKCNNETRRIKNKKVLDLACTNKNIVTNSVFTGMLDKHEFKCLVCNNKWVAKANSIANTSKSCPACKVVSR
ncbi:MAG: Zn finger protein HypA/HybF involved in hydrogenase expression [Oleiphilaceae bacterium]|jgi:Zn finger protein HypA/HybF involved in hydrogenase expression